MSTFSFCYNTAIGSLPVRLSHESPSKPAESALAESAAVEPLYVREAKAVTAAFFENKESYAVGSEHRRVHRL